MQGLSLVGATFELLCLYFLTPSCISILEESPYKHSRVFLIAANACLSSSNEDDCVSKVNLDLMADKGYKGLGSEAVGPRIQNILDALLFGPVPATSYDGKPRIYIYCTPCRHQIEVALSICGRIVHFNGIIRVDNRLASSCCHDTPVLQKFISLITTVNKYEADWRVRNEFKRSWVTSHYDIPWCEQRFVNIEAGGEQEDEVLSMKAYFQVHKDDARCAAMIVISESPDSARLASVVPLVPPKRPVRAGEIYILDKIQIEKEGGPKVRWKPTFFTRFF